MPCSQRGSEGYGVLVVGDPRFGGASAAVLPPLWPHQMGGAACRFLALGGGENGAGFEDYRPRRGSSSPCPSRPRPRKQAW